MLLARRNYNHDLWNKMINDTFFGDDAQQTQPSYMRTDIRDTEAGYILDIELPGFCKEDIEAELEDGYLTIRASHHEEQPEGERYLTRERYHGACSRSFYVGEDLHQDEIKAAFKNGILTVIVPKKRIEDEKPQPKLIAID